MSDREIALFNLGKSLVELLGEEQAIADLTLLYKQHPEMFRDKEEVREVIDKVVNEPDLIVRNPKAKNDKDFLAIKQLNSKKIGDIAIRNDNGTNVIFHANKKNTSKFSKIKIEEQMLVEASSVKTAPTRSDHYANKPNDLSRDIKILSTPASTIIPQSPNNDEETYMIPNQNTSNTHFITQDSISNLSLEEQISLAKENQKTLNAMPKASDIDKDINKDNTQENTQTQDTTQRVETQSQNSTLRRK